MNLRDLSLSGLAGLHDALDLVGAPMVIGANGTSELIPRFPGVALAVVGTHAGAFAVQAVRVLASRAALLLFIVGLDEDDLAITLDYPLGEVIEGRSRELPALPAADVIWLLAPTPAQPVAIVLRVGQLDEQLVV